REASLLPRARGALVAALRVAILLLARDRVLARQRLAGLAHQLVAERTQVAVAVHGVQQRLVAQLLPPAHVHGQVRDAAHVLDATRQRDVGVPQSYRLRGTHHRLHAARARLVDRERGHGVGKPGAAHDLAREVGTVAGLARVAGN